MPFPSEPPVEVCLLMRQFYPVMAGAAERFRRYSPGLWQRGVRLNAVARQADAALPLAEQLHEGLHVQRVPFQEGTPAWDVALLEESARSLQRLSRFRRAVLHTNIAFKHTRPLLADMQRRGTPTVWLGSMMEDHAAGRSWLASLRERLRLRWTLSVFDVAAVGSTAMRDWLRAAWVPAQCVRVIGHGVDLARFHPVDSVGAQKALRTRFSLPEEAVITLMVGTITARKGVHLLLEAWEQRLAADPRAVLVIAGAFDRPTVVSEDQQKLVQFQTGLRQRLERLSSTGRVFHLGEVKAIDDLMRAADLLILPSDREGVPNVVLEGMASGLPCLLTPFMGLPREELGDEGRLWKLCQREVHSIGAALAELIEDEALRRTMGRAAAQRAARLFGLDRTLDDYAALYHELAGRG